MGIWGYRNMTTAWIVFLFSEALALYLIRCVNNIDYTASGDDFRFVRRHIMFMEINLVVTGHGIVVFRLLPGAKTNKIKWLHVIIHALGGCGAWYDYKNHISGRGAHIIEYSAHLWMGQVLASLYGIQFLLGLITYYACNSQSLRKIYSGFHNLLGIIIFILWGCSLNNILLRIAMTRWDFLNTYSSRMIVSNVGYVVMICSIVVSPYLEWPLVGSI